MAIYHPDRDMPKRQSPLRSELERMLQEAVKNTGGAPLATAPQLAKTKSLAPAMPSAHHVAVAIVAASRALQVDPIAVASGASGTQRGGLDPGVWNIARARAYAAIALGTVFPDCSAMAIGRVVGSNSPAAYLSRLRKDVFEAVAPKWWDQSISECVITALRTALREG